MRIAKVKKLFVILPLVFVAGGLNANPVAGSPLLPWDLHQREWQTELMLDANGGLLYDGVSMTNRQRLIVTSISRLTASYIGVPAGPEKVAFLRKRNKAPFPFRRPVLSTRDFPVPVRGGFQFEGWHTKPEGGIKVVPNMDLDYYFSVWSTNKMVEPIPILYAHWRHTGWRQEKFTCELYRWLAKNDGNIVFSPHGVGGICALMASGARGGAGEAFEEALGLPATAIEKIVSMFFQDNYEMDYRWASSASPFWLFPKEESKETRYDDRYYDFGTESFKSSEDYGFELSNWVWGGSENESRIIGEGKKYFNLFYCGCQNNPRIDIRNFVCQHVRFGPLVNEARGKGSFKKDDGAFVSVNVINGEVNAKLCRDEDFSAISIPCALFHPGIVEREGSLEMWVIMPNDGVELSRIEELLSEKFICEVGQKLSEEKRVSLSMPFLHVNNAHKLDTALRGIGLGVAFDPESADFSGLGLSSIKGNVYLSEVIHGVDLFVYGAGSDSLAKRTWHGLVSCIGLPPQSFAIDRAFVFLIKNKETGSIYFAGRVVDPSADFGYVSDQDYPSMPIGKSAWQGVHWKWSFETGDGSRLFFKETDFDWGQHDYLYYSDGSCSESTNTTEKLTDGREQ